MVDSIGNTPLPSTPKRDDTRQNPSTDRSSDRSGSVFDQGLASGFQSATSDAVKDMMTGNFDIGKTLTNINQMIQKQLIGTVKSKIVDMLLGGNDLADAGVDKAKTAGHITSGAAAITKIQKQLLDGGLNALQQLLTEGKIDMETYAKNLMNTMIEVGVKGCEADVLGEETNELAQKNNELEQALQSKLDEKKIKMEKDKDGNMTFTDESGQPVDPNADDDIKDIVAQIQSNNTTITANRETLTEMTITNEVLTDNVVTGIQDVVTGGKDLSTAIGNLAANVISDGVQQITNTVLEHVGLLQTDAVTAGVNGATDAAAESAAPGAAASVAGGSLGAGAAKAAQILFNGAADGVAAGIRTLTGSSAIGGIVTGLASGKGLSEVLATTMRNQACEYINEQVQKGVSALTDPLRENVAEETELTEDRKSKYGISTDEDARA